MRSRGRTTALLTDLRGSDRTAQGVHIPQAISFNKLQGVIEQFTG